jgi:hypothetical protein
MLKKPLVPFVLSLALCAAALIAGCTTQTADNDRKGAPISVPVGGGGGGGY